jgi:ribonuclease HI
MFLCFPSLRSNVLFSSGQTDGYKGAKFKSFPTEHEALAFCETYRTPPPPQARDENDNDLDKISNKKRKIKMKKYKIIIVIHFDGGSRGNPGLSGSGAELRVSEITMSNDISTSCHTTTTTEDETEVCSRTLHLLKFLGQRSTNNEAEYQALLLALGEALNQVRGFAECHGLADDCVANLIVKGDSDLVIKQILGKYKVQSHTLLPLYHESKSLIKSIQQVMDCHMEFLHIPRGENTVADGKFVRIFFFHIMLVS